MYFCDGMSLLLRFSKRDPNTEHQRQIQSQKIYDKLKIQTAKHRKRNVKGKN